MNDGCDLCNRYWSKHPRKRPAELSVNYENQTMLFQCTECGTYWEETQRYPHVITEKDAKTLYPDYFANIN